MMLSLAPTSLSELLFMVIHAFTGKQPWCTDQMQPSSGWMPLATSEPSSYLPCVAEHL